MAAAAGRNFLRVRSVADIARLVSCVEYCGQARRPALTGHRAAGADAFGVGLNQFLSNAQGSLASMWHRAEPSHGLASGRSQPLGGRWAGAPHRTKQKRRLEDRPFLAATSTAAGPYKRALNKAVWREKTRNQSRAAARLALDRSSITRWRNRMGEERPEALLQRASDRLRWPIRNVGTKFSELVEYSANNGDRSCPPIGSLSRMPAVCLGPPR